LSSLRLAAPTAARIVRALRRVADHPGSGWDAAGRGIRRHGRCRPGRAADGEPPSGAGTPGL